MFSPAAFLLGILAVPAHGDNNTESYKGNSGFASSKYGDPPSMIGQFI